MAAEGGKTVAARWGPGRHDMEVGAEPAGGADRPLRFWSALWRSRLTRKIITFNLVALNCLIAGILALDAGRDGLAVQRANALVVEAELVADVFEAQIAVLEGAALGETVAQAGKRASLADHIDVAATLDGLDLRHAVEVRVYDPALARLDDLPRHSALQAIATASASNLASPSPAAESATVTDWIGAPAMRPFPRPATLPQGAVDRAIAETVAESLVSDTRVATGRDVRGATIFTVATPVLHGGTAVGAVALVSPEGEIDSLVWTERRRLVQIFATATLVSVGLSLVLASTISHPISALAAAAERGRDTSSPGAGRVRIPDLTARADEIGRLSGALRGMVTALYRRIEANEQFAADVAHEIKNPLASLRSAVSALGVTDRADQRGELLRVIDHDVRRLDRLVSDISNASRLDCELVREEQRPFDLMGMLLPICTCLGDEAARKGIEFITDLPQGSAIAHGLKARLAQVFVNLISNAVSFCEEGDAIRIWARRRQGRMCVVVEDTGPGIPEEALEKVFDRFYSHRPDGDFGNNSGLGLAISRQIVEAHGGTIWAENVRPTRADLTSEPHGTRFVVSLPV